MVLSEPQPGGCNRNVLPAVRDQRAELQQRAGEEDEHAKQLEEVVQEGKPCAEAAGNNTFLS